MHTKAADACMAPGCLTKRGHHDSADRCTGCDWLEPKPLSVQVTLVLYCCRPVLDKVTGVSYELSEAQYAANEREDTWVQRLLGTLVSFATWLQPLTTGQVFDTILCLVLDRVGALLCTLTPRMHNLLCILVTSW